MEELSMVSWVAISFASLALLAFLLVAIFLTAKTFARALDIIGTYILVPICAVIFIISLGIALIMLPFCLHAENAENNPEETEQVVQIEIEQFSAETEEQENLVDIFDAEVAIEDRQAVPAEEVKLKTPTIKERFEFFFKEPKEEIERFCKEFKKKFD